MSSWRYYTTNPLPDGRRLGYNKVDKKGYFGREGEMDGASSFGYWLRRRRKALDLTQDELARQAGCATTTIKKIEADERRPSRQLAERLADLLALAPEARTAFLKAARAELAADRLAVATQPLDAPASAAPSLAAPLPTGTVTFLFTDIEGSTQLWARQPQVMRAALARHDALLREAIEAHGGYVFKTVGDAVCAAFTTAADAVSASLAAQRALQAQPWDAFAQADSPRSKLELRVRAALHTGAAELREGDYFGHTLSRAARLRDAGHGGQTLLALATAELVRDQLPPDIELRDLGAHRLKDLTRPEQIFQLVAPDLPAAFPPLRTLDTFAHNLPAQLTSLIGRTEEVTAVCERLRRANVRLLTLTGPGGTGKTRLALQAAAELLDAFADGVCFVALAPVSDPTLVAATIAQTLGVQDSGAQPLVDRLKEYLGAKQLLLVLDNFEQIVDAAPLVVELLAAAPDLKVLVTSRVVLHLSGEHEFVVPPLAVPDPTHLPPLDRLTQYEAVRLFIERAQAVQADFAVTNANAPAVAEICARLDGLPLAIELAAARSKLFAPEALLARLSNRLRVLTGGARDLPARQQTLRNTIDWSYNLLDIGERTLFARLAVFVGGGTLEAAEVVAGWNVRTFERSNVLDELASLVDKSLLRQEQGVDGEARFVMLETIREYASERLAAHGEAETLRRRHAQYYLTLAEQAEPQLHGRDQQLWLNRLEQEHDNVRAALRWSATAGDTEIGLCLAGALGPFWQIHGHHNEGSIWLDTLLSRSAPMEPTAPRAKALIVAGDLANDVSDFATARLLFEESLAISQALGDTHNRGYALKGLGEVAYIEGNSTQAEALFQESLGLFRARGDAVGSGSALNDLGHLALDQGDTVAARAYYEESRAIGNKWSMSMALNNLGEVARWEGDYQQGAMYYKESLRLAQELHDKAGMAIALSNLAHVKQRQGDNPQAVARFRAGLALAQELGMKHVIADCLAGLAGVAAAEGKSERAARLLGASEALLDAIGATLASTDQADYDRSVATTRAQLDEATFAAAWAAGRALPLEQAIAYALAEDA